MGEDFSRQELKAHVSIMKSLYICIFLVIIGILVYGLMLKGNWGNTPESIKDDINYSLRDKGRLLLTQNLVEHNSFALSREQADIAAPDAGFYNGNWFLVYPPGMSVFAVPFYILGSQFNISQVTTFATGAIFAICNLVFIFLIARQILKLPYWSSLLASFIFGFASTSLGYAASLFQHHAAVFFILASFYAVYRYKHQKKWGWLWGIFIWVSYSLAIFTDYPNAILMLPVIVYFFLASLSIKKVKQTIWRFSFSPPELYLQKLNIKLRPAIILTSFFFIVLTLLHGYYNYANFGKWSRVSSSLPGYREEVTKILDQRNILDLENLSQSDVKIDKLNSYTKVFAFFKNKYMISNGFILLFSPDRGLFIFSPVLILGLLGISYTFAKMNIEKGILISIAGVNFMMYSLWGDPWAGSSFGPRYLIPLMPILALFTSYFLVYTTRQIFSKLIAFIFIIFSLGIALLGGLTTNAVPAMFEGVVFQYKFGIPAALAIIPSITFSAFSVLTSIPIRETILSLNGKDSKYGFIYTLDLLNHEYTGSFVYNNFFRSNINLTQYYWLVFVIMISIFFFVLFIMPKYERSRLPK